MEDRDNIGESQQWKTQARHLEESTMWDTGKTSGASTVEDTGKTSEESTVEDTGKTLGVSTIGSQGRHQERQQWGHREDIGELTKEDTGETLGKSTFTH